MIDLLSIDTYILVDKTYLYWHVLHNLKQRLLDDDNGGTIGFPEIQKTLDLCNAKVFSTQTSLSGGGEAEGG